MTPSFSLIVIFLAQVILKIAVSGFAPFRNIPKSFSGLRLSSSILDEPALRIGHGFDIHRLIEGTKLIIGPVPHLFFESATRICRLNKCLMIERYPIFSFAGGVDVPFHVGADAHSDGDAMYHRYSHISISVEEKENITNNCSTYEPLIN